MIKSREVNLKEKLIWMSGLLLLVSCSFNENIQSDKLLKLKEAKEIVASVSKISPIYIKHLNVISPDHPADGTGVVVRYQNISNETLTYVDFEIQPYDSMGKIQESAIDNKSAKIVRDDGPIKPMGNIADVTKKVYFFEINVPGGNWNSVWFKKEVVCIVIKKVTIEKLDGLKIIIEDPEKIKKIFSKGSHHYINKHDQSFFRTNQLYNANDCTYENQLSANNDQVKN